MIDFENVTCQYPGGPSVLKNISFHIGEGEQVGLIGANGAGKSTLLKAALGLVAVSGGGAPGGMTAAGSAAGTDPVSLPDAASGRDHASVTIAGLSLNRANLPAIRKAAGYLLQDSENQMFMPTVLDDMIFGPMNYGMTRAEAEAKAEGILETLGLTHLKTRPNHKISGGEKKMTAIATILAMEPRILLLDEPSASLDPKNRRRLINILNALPETKVIASHDLDLILDTCTRVLLLSEGQIAADGKAGEILRDRELLERYDLELPLCLQGIS